MAELKEIETKDEGGVSSGDASPGAHLPSESNHVSRIPIFALHRASTGPVRIDLCLGGITTCSDPRFFL